MKTLYFALLVLLASCGTSHKTVTSSKKTVDSVVTTVRDTSHVTHEKSSSDNLTAKDVHIRVEYPELPSAADSALAVARQQPAGEIGENPPPRNNSERIAAAIRDAIAASGGAGRLPSSITIDIGSIQDSSSRTSKKDSGSVHNSTAASVKKTDSEKSKEVTHTGLSLGYKIGIGLFLLILLLVVAWRLARKFKLI